ncbi:MAG: CDP-alcohol phosphatidyltransferase family protein [Chlamydiales bacterium]
MLEEYLRPSYQQLCVAPIAKLLNKHRCPPSLITLFSLVFGVLACPLMILQHSHWAIFSLLISGYCDTLDGTLARLSGQTSSQGTIFDILSDRIVEFSVILGLFSIEPLERGLASLFMLGSVLICMTSFLVVGIFTQNDSEKGFYYSPGIMERCEAFIFFMLMVLFPSYFSLLAWTFTCLVFLTAAIRVFQFRIQYLKSVT